MMVISQYITDLVAWQFFPVLVAVFICCLAWCFTRWYNGYTAQVNANMMIVAMLQGSGGDNGMMPDERLFRQMIDLPDRDPRWMTSSMVAPQVAVSADEKRKISRMEVFNMFYNNGIDDEVSRDVRPQNLFVIP